MANPRQRRKARSSSHRPVKQSRRTNKLVKKQRPIQGPKILQDGWDKHKTVRQNYAALGLAHSLTPTDSGGQDITHSRSAEGHQNAEPRPQKGRSQSDEKAGVTERLHRLNERTADGKMPRGFGRIIRDASGAVVDVVLAEEEPGGREAAARMKLDDDEIENGRIRSASGMDWLLNSNGGDGVVRALEEASKGRTKRARTSSSAETRYLSRLVTAHGTDYEAMGRDRRRNVRQYTAGQLRRAMVRSSDYVCLD